jgi:L-ascorbate metabolism protein UlaG (beta-lactamase superfamily)
MLRRLALASLIALSACAQEQAPATPVPDPGGQPAAQAVSILNAGVMTRHPGPQGDAIKFLFDPLYDDHFGSLEQLSPELIEAIVSGAPPYDGADAVFVSHAHGDHFSASMLNRMLGAQQQLVLVVPAQAVENLREDSGWNPEFADRVRGIALENGQASEAFAIAGATVEAFRSPHNGWPERHSSVHNLTFRVSAPMGEGRVSRVMHLGDADPAGEHYAGLAAFLAEKRTGLAMVPHWFYGREGLDRLIDATLNAETVVAIHVPVAVPANLPASGLPYFSGVNEMLEIPATP